MNFAITGVAGYVAPKHLQAIKDSGHKVVAAVDPNDSVGILDRHGFDVAFFTEFERFTRHIERTPPDWLSVCSPNFLHDAHTKAGLRAGANVICEKPLTLTPWNLDALEKIERETGRHVYTVLQLRLHPKVIELKKMLDANPRRRNVALTYITPRGAWYDRSWKADLTKSGGLTTNIGVHLFDLLIYLFGEVSHIDKTMSSPRRAAGCLRLKNADVSWRLSIAPEDGEKPSRTLLIDGWEGLELSEGFTDLHTRVYTETLAGRGFDISAARPAVELTYALRAFAK